MYLGRAKLAELLIKNGASLNVVRDETTPLRAAILWAKVCYSAGKFCQTEEADDVLEVLISHDVDVNEDNYKTLNFAIKDGFVETVELLVHAGANVNATDEFGFTPLHHCTSSSRKFDFLRLPLGQTSTYFVIVSISRR